MYSNEGGKKGFSGISSLVTNLDSDNSSVKRKSIKQIENVNRNNRKEDFVGKWFSILIIFVVLVLALVWLEIGKNSQIEPKKPPMATYKASQSEPEKSPVAIVKIPEPIQKITPLENTKLDKPLTSSTQNKELTLEVQKLLLALGYDTGPLDGLYGSKTASAIKAFQRDTGVSQNGKIDNSLLISLQEYYNIKKK